MKISLLQVGGTVLHSVRVQVTQWCDSGKAHMGSDGLRMVHCDALQSRLGMEPHRRMATTPLRGAGMSGKSKRLNSPGESGMANIMLCCFHCSRSSMPSSLCRTRSGAL